MGFFQLQVEKKGGFQFFVQSRLEREVTAMVTSKLCTSLHKHCQHFKELADTSLRQVPCEAPVRLNYQAKAMSAFWMVKHGGIGSLTSE